MDKETTRPKRIAAKKVLTYNINYHQVGYEREFQKALKYSLLEAEAAKARQLVSEEQQQQQQLQSSQPQQQTTSSRRKSQEKKENSLNKSTRTSASTAVTTVAVLVTNDLISSECRKVLDSTTTTTVVDSLNDLNDSSTGKERNLCDRNRLSTAKQLPLRKTWTDSHFPCLSSSSSSILSNEDQHQPTTSLLISSTQPPLPSQSTHSCTKTPIKRDEKKETLPTKLNSSSSTLLPSPINNKITKSGYTRKRSIQSGKLCLFSSPNLKSCHRPMRKAKPNVSLYDFHIEFDDEEVSPAKAKRSLLDKEKKNKKKRNRKKSQMFCIQTCIKNEIRKKLLQKSIKYSVSKSTEPSTTTTAAAGRNHHSNKIFTSGNRKHRFVNNNNNKSQTAKTMSRRPSSQQQPSCFKNDPKKQDKVLRKTQTLIRNLYKLRQYIQCRRQELLEEDNHDNGGNGINSPLKNVLKNMAKDLRSLLCQPAHPELDTIFYDPLTISGLMMTASGFSTADHLSELIDSFEMTTKKEEEEEEEKSSPSLNDDVEIKREEDENHSNEDELRQQLFLLLDDMKAVKKEKEDKQEEEEEEDLEFSTAQSSPVMEGEEGEDTNKKLILPKPVFGQTVL